MPNAISVTIIGGDAIKSALLNYGAPGTTAVAGAIYERLQEILLLAKRLTPYDTGALESSGQVDLPVIEGGSISVKIGFGNASTTYALEQHENLQYKHAPGRQAKYLETPINEAMPTFSEEVGANVMKRLGIA